MTWRTAFATVTGLSHERSGEPNQDAVDVAEFIAADGQAVLGIFAADGAGTAPAGKDGAATAVDAAVRFWEAFFAERPAAVDAAALGECLLTVRHCHDELAKTRQRGLRDFACTFLAVIALPDSLVALHIGDGAVVADFGDGCCVFSPPANGEYANTTFFVTDPEPQLSGEAIFCGQPARRIAVFTDGLQPFTLNASGCQTNPAFFDRRFHTLETASEEQLPNLNDALKAFLNLDMIRRHVSDDMTLVLASSNSR